MITFDVASEKIDLTAFERTTSFDDIATSNINIGGQQYLRVYVNDNENNQYITLKNIYASDISAGNFIFAPNTAPVAEADSYTFDEDQSIIINVSDLLNNDSDVQDLVPSFDGIVSQPSNGTLVDNQDGTFTYTPDANYNGDDSFTYKVVDSDGLISTGSVNLTINAVNDAPTAEGIIADAQVNIDESSVVISSAMLQGKFDDVDAGDNLTYSLEVNGGTSPAWLTINPANGEITSTNPTLADSGNYALVVTATDGSGSTVTQSFNLNVYGGNTDPVANNDIVTGSEDSPINIDVLANDTDADSDPLTVTGFDVSNTTGIVVDNGGGNFTYTPYQNLGAGEVGADSFTYTISDGNGGISTATVDITINGENDAPFDLQVNSNQISEDEAGAVVGSISFGDVDINDTHTFTVDDSRFEIVAGQLKLIDGIEVSHETEDTINLVLTVTDSSNASFNTNVTLEVNDDVDVIYGTNGDDTGANAIWGTLGQDIIYAGAGDDTIYALSGNDGIYAGAGADTVFAGEGNDTVYGSDGNDIIWGGLGNDLLHGEGGDDQINGGEGNDWIVGGADADTMTGDAGIDTASYENSNAAVGVDILNAVINGGYATGDTITDIENIVGSDHSDILRGDHGDNILSGGLGNDQLVGNGGDDLLIGGAGNDPLFGSSGNDELQGGLGNDYLYGGFGNDILKGEDGFDYLISGLGTDTLIGGAGTDSFKYDYLSDSNSFGGYDTIQDFEDGTDVINLVGLADDGITSFSDLTVTNDGTDTTVSANAYDFEIKINGVFALDQNDFVF